MKIVKMGLIILSAVSITTLSYGAASNITPANKTGLARTAPLHPRAAAGAAKIERGVHNILFGWTEIPKSIINTTKEKRNPILGITVGTLEGLGKAFPRTISGVSDIVTSPVGDAEKAYVSPAPLDLKLEKSKAATTAATVNTTASASVTTTDTTVK